MESNFKQGDKVFDILFGWGVVTEIEDVQKNPLSVKFEDGIIRLYTLDGRYYHYSLRTLSFTQYTLQGFSQERPIELPEIGERVMVSDDNVIWGLLKVTKIVDGKVHTIFKDWNYFKRLR